MRYVALLLFAAAACSSAPKPPAAPSVAAAATPPAAPADAAVPDAAAPDAGVPEAVMAAPAWVFRYTTPQRAETWTLRFAGGRALLVVETARGTQRYVGTATEGTSIAVSVATATAKLALDCKRTRRAVGAKCNDRKAKRIEVLDCYHPDFKAPMPFGPAPGVEYVDDASCRGYRLAR